MTPLEQKLLDLNLTVMSHRLETTLSEAAGKNLSAAATLEWLADMELEARRGRAIERRFKCSKLQTQPIRRGAPVRTRPAPPHSCVPRPRPAAFLTTKPAILRVFYVGTNIQNAGSRYFRRWNWLR